MNKFTMIRRIKLSWIEVFEKIRGNKLSQDKTQDIINSNLCEHSNQMVNINKEKDKVTH